MITEEDHVPQLWECPAEMVKPSPGFCRRCPSGSSGPGKEGAVHAARHQSQPHLPAPHLGEMQAVILFFFQFLPRNYLCATGAQQPDSVAAAWLAQASRAHRKDEGDKAPWDRQGGQQGLSSSGSFCLFNILQTSSAGEAPAHSLEARLLLQHWLWILNYTGLDVKHYIGGNKVMRALLMSLKIPLWRDVKSGLCMEIPFKLIPSIH